MRSKKVEFRVYWPLYERARDRCEEEKFRSFSRYLIWLMVRDVLMQKHPFAALIAEADPATQDALLKAMVNPKTDKVAESFCAVVLKKQREGKL